MTNEQAINQLKAIRSEFAVDMRLNDVEAFDMAIEALQQGCEKVTEGCDDLISRQQAINSTKYIFENDWMYPESQEKYVLEMLSDLPSAQPEQTKIIKEIRKWINSGNRGSADYFIVDKIEEIINKYE